MPRRALIIRRLDAALAKMRDRDMQVRAIYLNEQDWDAFNAARAKEIGCKACVCFLYGDHEIRSGETSVIYSTHGVGVCVPKAVP